MNREDFGNLALAVFGLFLIASGILQLSILLQVSQTGSLFGLEALSGVGLPAVARHIGVA